MLLPCRVDSRSIAHATRGRGGFVNTVAARFWSKLDSQLPLIGCWEWRGAGSANGYGSFRVGSRNLCAHRVSYELLVGPIPAGLQIDHVCPNRRCVNPDHLEPVSRPRTSGVPLLHDGRRCREWPRFPVPPARDMRSYMSTRVPSGRVVWPRVSAEAGRVVV